MNRRWISTVCFVIAAIVSLNACGCGPDTTRPTVSDTELKKNEDAMEKSKNAKH